MVDTGKQGWEEGRSKGRRTAGPAHSLESCLQYAGTALIVCLLCHVTHGRMGHLLGHSCDSCRIPQGQCAADAERRLPESYLSIKYGRRRRRCCCCLSQDKDEQRRTKLKHHYTNLHPYRYILSVIDTILKGREQSSPFQPAHSDKAHIPPAPLTAAKHSPQTPSIHAHPPPSISLPCSSPTAQQ